MSINGEPYVTYPETPMEKSGGWSMVGFILATVVGGAGFHLGWNLMGLLW
jgi:hypothetical protein